MNVTKIDPPDADNATDRISEPGKETRSRGLSGTRFTNDGNIGLRRNRQGNIAQHHRTRSITKRHVLELYAERSRRQFLTILRFDNRDWHVQNSQDLPPTSQRCLGLIEHLTKLGDRLQDQVDEEDEGDKFTHLDAKIRPPPDTDAHGDSKRNRRNEIHHRQKTREPD